MYIVDLSEKYDSIHSVVAYYRFPVEFHGYRREYPHVHEILLGVGMNINNGV